VETIKEQIGTIVGRGNLVTEPGELRPYGADNISFIPSRTPLMAARPGTVEEIRAVLQVAARNRMPVTPFSSSSNGHGGSIPAVPGITLDLRRLNRIHVVDPQCRNAIIEPGVSFSMLQEKANEAGLRALTPIELPADCSVISTYAEMAPLYAWPRYGTESILTSEVLLPGGESLGTGLAAIPMVDKPYFPFGTNPSYLNKVWFGAQGTLGVITRAAVKLKTDHATRQVLFVPLEGFPQSFPLLREVKRLDYPVESFLATAPYLAGLLASDAGEHDRLRGTLPPVTAVMVLRGEPAEVAYQREDLLDLAHRMGLGLEEGLEERTGAADRILEEINRPEGYRRFQRLRGGYVVMPFICMAGQIPMFETVLSQLCGAFGYDRATIGALLLPVEPARVHFQYSFYFDPEDPKEQVVVRKLYDLLGSTLIKMGAFFSRPYGAWADLVFSKAGAYRSMLSQIKREIDPDNIMNPGKLGF
jgi:FAD/FMN-containing dehydrogenase